jgi:protein-disulfide isomerase
MDKKFAGILVACIVALGIVFVITNKKTEAPAGSSKNTLSNHVIGDNKKKVSLVEYGDYECPYCKGYESIMEQVRAKYSTDIQFQFRNFPLQQHQNARAGARAAEAAAKQGKFWEMHDKLYAEQDPDGKVGWVASSDPLDQYFVDYAKGLNLDVNKFKDDYSSTAVNDIINADQNEGLRLKVDATPTFFLQGQKLDDAEGTLSYFSKKIDQAIKDASK